MRTLILLIVISAFLLWFGYQYRDINHKYARLALIIGWILAALVLAGFWGLL